MYLDDIIFCFVFLVIGYMTGFFINKIKVNKANRKRIEAECRKQQSDYRILELEKKLNKNDESEAT